MALTKTDIEDLNMLMNANNVVISSAMKLSDLEYHGCYGTEEYDQEFKKLKHWIAIADSLIDNLSTSYAKIKEIIDYIIEKGPDKNLRNDKKIQIYTCSTGDIENLTTYRLYNKFIMKMFADKDNVLQDIMEIAAKKHGQPEVIASEQFQGFALYQTVASSYLAADQFNIFLVLLHQNYNETEAEKQYAINRKYYCGLLIPELEKMFLSTKFSLNERPFLIGGLPKKLYNISDNQAEEYLKSLMIPAVDEYANALLLIPDHNIFVSSELRSIIKSSLLDFRSRLTSANNETLTFLRNRLESIIAAKQNPYNQIIIGLIREAFDAITADKEIPLSLDFGLQ